MYLMKAYIEQMKVEQPEEYQKLLNGREEMEVLNELKNVTAMAITYHKMEEEH